MSQANLPHQQVLPDRARLLRWGFAWFVFGLLLLFTDLFHLDGPVWQALILILAIFITPESQEKGHWLKRVLFIVGSMVILIALVFMAVWVEGKTGVSSGIFLAVLALLAGIVCQLLGGVLQLTSPSSADRENTLINKIREL